MKRDLAGAHEYKDGIAWVRGDAMIANDVVLAAQGSDVIVHAVNPPGYRRWSELVLPMLDNTIAAARVSGATIVLPGTIYNYGPDAFPVLSEHSPQRPLTRKGKIRVEMERRLQSYAAQHGRVLVVRAGDFFGPKAANNWFSQGLVKPGKVVSKISNPASAGIGHQWSYLPDVARTVLELLGRLDSLERYATFHLAGHFDADGTQMTRSIQRVVGKHTGITPKIVPFPWWLIRLMAPFNETLHEMLEMRYLWRRTVRMDNAKLVATLGREPSTPLDEAVEATLVGLDFLPEGAGAGGGCIRGARPSVANAFEV